MQLRSAMCLHVSKFDRVTRWAAVTQSNACISTHSYSSVRALIPEATLRLEESAARLAVDGVEVISLERLSQAAVVSEKFTYIAVAYIL